MVAAVRSINSVVGWEYLLAGLVVCSIVSLLVIRTKTQTMIAVLIQMILLESSDVVWTFLYFPQGEYVNHGMLGVYGLLVYPVLCLLAYAVQRKIVRHSPPLSLASDIPLKRRC